MSFRYSDGNFADIFPVRLYSFLLVTRFPGFPQLKTLARTQRREETQHVNPRTCKNWRGFWGGRKCFAFWGHNAGSFNVCVENVFKTLILLSLGLRAIRFYYRRDFYFNILKHGCQNNSFA